MPPPVPRCSSWAYSSLVSPSHFSLPRYGSRVGLHIVLFEMLWGGGEEIAHIVADVTRWRPPMQKPNDLNQSRIVLKLDTDRSDRNEFVELARCRHRARRRASAV